MHLRDGVLAVGFANGSVNLLLLEKLYDSPEWSDAVLLKDNLHDNPIRGVWLADMRLITASWNKICIRSLASGIEET